MSPARCSAPTCPSACGSGERADARRRRRRHVHGRRLGPRRADRGHQGPERAAPIRPRRWSRARGASASRARRSSTTRARWASTRSSRAACRRSRFLTTEGHRDMLDRGPGLAPAGGADRPVLAAVVRRRGPAARPALPAPRRSRERLLADGARARRRSTRSRPARSSRCSKRCDVEGVAICLINAYVNPQHEQRLRELAAGGARRTSPISISSEISPLAKEYARASTTVIDVLHEADLHATTPTSSTRELPELGLHRRAELRRLRGDAPAVAGGAEARRSGSCSPGRRRARSPAAHFGEAIGETQPDLLRRRRHVDRHLARRRRPAVRQQHVRARARPDHQRALDGDLQRRRGRRVDRLDLALRATSSSGPAARAPSPARPATAAAASCRRSPTPAC